MSDSAGIPSAQLWSDGCFYPQIGMYYNGDGPAGRQWHFWVRWGPATTPIYLHISGSVAYSTSAAAASAHEALDRAIELMMAEAKNPHVELPATDEQVLQYAEEQRQRANRWKRAYEDLEARVKSTLIEEDDEEGWGDV